MKNTNLKVIREETDGVARTPEIVTQNSVPATSQWTRLFVAFALALGAAGLKRGLEHKHRSENTSSSENTQAKK